MQPAEPIPGVRLWLVLWKAYESVRRHALCSIRELGLPFSDFAVLEILLHKGPLPVGEIGNRVGLTSGAISSAIQRLESKKLLARGPDPWDGRTRLVTLTAKGRRLIEKAFAEHVEAMERAVSGLSPREREEVTTLLRKLGYSAEKLYEGQRLE